MKIFYKKALFSLIMGLFLFQSQIFAQNLVLNGGFEDGYNVNWSSRNGGVTPFSETAVAAEVKTGSKALKVVSTISDPANQYKVQYVSALINTPVGNKYSYSVYIKATNPAGGLRLSTISPANNYAVYGYSANVVIGTDWQKVTLNFTAVEPQTQVAIDLGIAANTYFVDDAEVLLTYTAPIAPSATAALLNPSFELGAGDVFTNWTKTNGGTLAVATTVSSEVHEGTRGLKVISDPSRPKFDEGSGLDYRAYSIQLLSDEVATTVGAVYTFKIWVKAANAFAGAIRFSTNPYPDPTADYSNNYDVTTGWTQLTWVFTAKKTTTKIALDLGKNENIYFLDDMTFTTPVVLINCLNQNGGFEAGTGDNFTNYTKYNNPAGFTQTTAAGEFRNGLRALKVTSPGGNPWETQMAGDLIPSTVGVNYKYTVFVKGLGTVAPGSTVRVSTQPNALYSDDHTVTADWTQLSWTFRANESSTRILFDFGKFANTYVVDDACLEVVCDNSWTPPIAQTPMATGKTKYFGNIYSAAQLPYADKYFNQVITENAGKWGEVEGTRDVFNWTVLDAARAYAEAKGFPFRFHVLLWGAQQPTWLKPLSDADKLMEIKQWFMAVRDRYNMPSGPFKKPEYIEVFNETMNDPPNNLNNATATYPWRPNNITDAGSGGYLDALRSLNTQYGTTPSDYDYVINAFKLAREIFGCDAKLVINDYAVENIADIMATYKGVVDLLKADNLVDAVGMQLHTFNTQLYVPYTAANIAAHTAGLEANLATIASTGLPIMITEMDIDGDVSIDPTSFARVTTGTQAEKDAFQKSEYERVFPIYWNHPSVIGMTLWGYRNGHWRSANEAYLMDKCTGAPKPAMTYLETYVRGTTPAAPVAFPTYACVNNPIGGTITNNVTATSMGTPINGSNTSLFVKLIQNNDVKHVAKVGADGKFLFFKVRDGVYKAILSKTFDQNPTAISLPTGLSFFAEGLFDGTNSALESTVDGMVRVNVLNGNMILDVPMLRQSAAPAFTTGELLFALAGSPLPVDLISFDATTNDNAIILNWKTANEKGFSHFEVQKSLNSKEFGTLAKVNGTAKNYYSTIDSNPTEGINYYRLKMIDLDGTSKLSSIIGVKFEKNADYTLVQNPAENGEIKVTTNLKDANFTLLNTTGASINSTVTQLSNNTYSIKVNKTIPGLYFLKVISNGKAKTHKILMN
jgi:GH35 family endo-1,4-beta-xylanase